MPYIELYRIHRLPTDYTSKTCLNFTRNYYKEQFIPLHLIPTSSIWSMKKVDRGSQLIGCVTFPEQADMSIEEPCPTIPYSLNALTHTPPVDVHNQMYTRMSVQPCVYT